MRASIIIPYYQRIHHLQKVLKALSNQAMSACDYEIIVIDDGSSSSVEGLVDSTEGVAKLPDLEKSMILNQFVGGACAPNLTPEHHAQKSRTRGQDDKMVQKDDFAGSASFAIPSTIKLIRTPHRGAAAARNSGIAASKGEVVIFLDSDIVVDPQFIENHCRFHEDYSNTVALGARIHTDPSGKVQGADTRTKLLTRYSKKLSELMHPWFMTYTCNVSLRREWIVKELFDENYLFWGLEDSEWAYRLYLQGANFTFIESVTGVHLYHDRTMTTEKFQGWKANLAYTIAKHPKLFILERFLSVFDPQIRADYFETYDQFEEICVL